MGQRRAGTGETSKCVSASRVIQRHIVTRLVNGNRKAVTNHRQDFRYGEAAMHPGGQYQVRQRDCFKLDPATLESTKYKDKRRSVQGPLFDQTRSNTSRSRVPTLSSRALTMTMALENGLSSRAETWSGVLNAQPRYPAHSKPQTCPNFGTQIRWQTL